MLILKNALIENGSWQRLFFKLRCIRGGEITARGVNGHSMIPRKGLFWTTTPVSTRFVCKAPEGRLL